MKIKSHNELPEINTENVKFQGVIDANYNDLVNAFGKPLAGDLNMIDAQWKLRLITDSGFGCNILLHNFKNGKNYLGEDGLDVKKISIWNVSTSRPNINAKRYLEKALKKKIKV